MNFEKDENDTEQKNFLAYKNLGDQMAFLALGLGYNEPPSKTFKDDKGKMKYGKTGKATIPVNKSDNKKNTKMKNSFNESDNKLQNISNNNNLSNNSINNFKKNQIPVMKNRSNSSAIGYPLKSSNLKLNQNQPKLSMQIPNKLENNNNKYQYEEASKNQNNSLSNNESLSNDMPEIPEIEVIEVEKINPEEIDKESNKSINPFIFEKVLIKKSRQHTIYERAMKNLKKKETKIGKERNLIIKKKLNQLKPIPDMNKKSIEFVIKKGEYIPIENRAAQIHSQHLTQIILNEELKRIEKENKEEEELKNNVNNNKKYQEKEWNEFVQKCFDWKKNVFYKRKAEEIYRYKRDRKLNYKPIINENSKKIMKKMTNKNNNSFDDVFTRLYNDYEEHKEREKILKEKYMPPFNPKINNFHFTKNFRNNKKYRNNSYDNSYEIFVTDDNKNNFFLESQMTINDGKMLKKHKRAMKFVNKNKSNRNYNNINDNNKIYKPTQTTNNTNNTNNITTYMNTEANVNKNKFKKYIPTENNYITTETNLNTYQNNLPTDINILTDDNKIINEINENNNSISNNEPMINEERILKELDEAKLINKERKENENENSLYKINIMESTPQNIKQNVIIPSNKYQDFFDIEEINEL